MSFYKGKYENVWMFGGVNKHLFRKVNLIIRAQFVLCRLHNSDSLKLYESFATKRNQRLQETRNWDSSTGAIEQTEADTRATTRNNKTPKTRLILHIPYGTKQVFVNTTNISKNMNFTQYEFCSKSFKIEVFVKGVPYWFCSKIMGKKTTKGGVKASVKSSRDITVPIKERILALKKKSIQKAKPNERK